MSKALPQGKKPLLLSEVLEIYLKEIYTYRFLKADQLTRLLYKMGMLTTVQTRLKQLVDAKYLHAFQLPTVKSKSPYMYAVIGKGLTHLQGMGLDVEVYYRPSELDELSHAFLWHVLELNDFLIAASHVNTVNPAFRLHRMEHDLELKKHPMKVKLAAGSGEYKKEVTKLIWPDAFLEFRFSPGDGRKEQQACFWHEEDRATESEKKFREKIGKIVAAIRSGMIQEYFGIKTLSGVTFATTAGINRVEQMQAWTMQELEVLHAKPQFVELFLFTIQPKKAAEIDLNRLFFQPVWLLPRKESRPVALLEG